MNPGVTKENEIILIFKELWSIKRGCFSSISDEKKWEDEFNCKLFLTEKQIHAEFQLGIMEPKR